MLLRGYPGDEPQRHIHALQLIMRLQEEMRLILSRRVVAGVQRDPPVLQRMRPAAADLVLAWDQTRVSLPVTADPDRIVLAQIQEAMKGEKKPYITAAQYYYNTGKDLTPAIGWLDASIKAEPSYYAYYWKAKLLQKQGKNREAIAAANQSLALVKTDKNEISKAEYTRLNQEVLAAASAKK